MAKIFSASDFLFVTHQYMKSKLSFKIFVKYSWLRKSLKCVHADMFFLYTQFNLFGYRTSLDSSFVCINIYSVLC